MSQGSVVDRPAVRRVMAWVVALSMLVGTILFVGAFVTGQQWMWPAAAAAFGIAWVISIIFKQDPAATVERGLVQASGGWTAATFERRYLNLAQGQPLIAAARALASAHGYHEVPAPEHPVTRRWIWLRFSRDEEALSSPDSRP